MRDLGFTLHLRWLFWGMGAFCVLFYASGLFQKYQARLEAASDRLTDERVGGHLGHRRFGGRGGELELGSALVAEPRRAFDLVAADGTKHRVLGSHRLGRLNIGRYSGRFGLGASLP